MGKAIGEGLKAYYKAKIEELEIQARDKQLNLRRLEAQRNDLNTKGAARCAGCAAGAPTALGRCTFIIDAAPIPKLLGSSKLSPSLCCSKLMTVPVLAVRLLKEELQLLQEPGSYVGEVAKVLYGHKHCSLLKVFSRARSTPDFLSLLAADHGQE